MDGKLPNPTIGLMLIGFRCFDVLVDSRDPEDRKLRLYLQRLGTFSTKNGSLGLNRSQVGDWSSAVSSTTLNPP